MAELSEIPPAKRPGAAGPLATPTATVADGPGYHATVWTLALGQVLSWAVLYYGFSSLVLPMETTMGWSRPAMMGALTLGLAVWGAARGIYLVRFSNSQHSILEVKKLVVQ